MSNNKGKIKVESTAKTVGKPKAAIMNSRNPKKPVAISGDTMNGRSMYKKGGSTTLPKKQAGGKSESEGKSKAMDKVFDYGDRIIDRIGKSDDLTSKYIIKPGVKALFKGADAVTNAVGSAAKTVGSYLKDAPKNLNRKGIDSSKPVGGYKTGGMTKSKSKSKSK